MDQNVHRQISIRALLTSPFISFIAITPIYILTNYQIESFFSVWLKATIGVLICWLVQALVFHVFKKRTYPNWGILLALMTILISIMLLTGKSVVFNEIPTLSSNSDYAQFILRFLTGSSICFIIYLLIDLIYSQKEKVQLAIENSSLRYNNLENEYRILKAQINPHFLFNALNISKSLIKTQPKRAEKYLINLSEFLRNSLTNEQKSVSLKEELDHVHQYIDLQKVRFENTFEYIVQVEGHHLERHLPPFTLTTLAENALKHNSFSEEAPLRISVQAVKDYLEVSNNMKSKIGVVSTHTGLSNLNQRSQMLSNAELIIENDNQLFSVKIKLIDK